MDDAKASLLMYTPSRLGTKGSSYGGEDCSFDSNEDEVVPKVDEVSLVEGVFDGALGGDGDEDFVKGEERLEEEAWVEAIEVEVSREM
nr:hypothetical protein [Tanacetum cinerariifolium]